MQDNVDCHVWDCLLTKIINLPWAAGRCARSEHDAQHFSALKTSLLLQNHPYHLPNFVWASLLTPWTLASPTPCRLACIGTHQNLNFLSSLQPWLCLQSSTLLQENRCASCKICKIVNQKQPMESRSCHCCAKLDRPKEVDHVSCLTWDFSVARPHALTYPTRSAILRSIGRALCGTCLVLFPAAIEIGHKGLQSSFLTCKVFAWLFTSGYDFQVCGGQIIGIMHEWQELSQGVHGLHGWSQSCSPARERQAFCVRPSTECITMKLKINEI